MMLFVDFLDDAFFGKKTRLLNDKVNKGLFFHLQRKLTLLFQYVICYALFNFCFTLLKILTLPIFIRRLPVTAVWRLFNKFTDSAANQMSLSRGICGLSRSAGREKASKEIFG